MWTTCNSLGPGMGELNKAFLSCSQPEVEEWFFREGPEGVVYDERVAKIVELPEKHAGQIEALVAQVN